MSNTPRFVYWKIAARAQTPMLLLHAGNVQYTWDDVTANAWPEPKFSQPFGQLPVLYHDDLGVAQSGTVTRYCARLAGLWPEDKKEWLKVDMLIEHCNDIYTLMAKAKYAGNNAAQYKAWGELADNKYPEHVAWLVKMLGSDDYFGRTEPNAGDVVVFSVLNLADRAGIQCPLNKFPTLLEHSKRVAQLGTINEYLVAEYPVYFKSPSVEENMVVESS